MRASDRAYAALRDDIIEWRLLPGTVLAEVEQSARLGISRTPLREALSRLTAAAAEHAAIAEAIAAGNPRLAEAATTVHLHRSLSHVKAVHASAQKEPHG